MQKQGRSYFLVAVGVALAFATCFAAAIAESSQRWALDRQAEKLLRPDARDWTQQVPYCAECLDELRAPK